MVATDLVRRGYKIALPYGEDSDYDLIVARQGRLERVQVKYTTSDGQVIQVPCQSNSLTKGKVRAIKRYTAETVDWMAVYDRTSDRCYYVPASELATGRCAISLRLVPTRNNQRQGVRYAQDYADI